MLRRAAASLLPRLQQQTQGAAPLSAVLNQFPGCFSLGEDKPSCCAARRKRGLRPGDVAGRKGGDRRHGLERSGSSAG